MQLSKKYSRIVIIYLGSQVCTELSNRQRVPKQRAEPLPRRVCCLKAHLGPVILQESAKRKINTTYTDTKEQIFAECVKAFENRRDFRRVVAFVSHCTGWEKREKRRICYYQKDLKRSLDRLEPWADYKETALNKICNIMISFGYKIKGSLGADYSANTIKAALRLNSPNRS